MQAYFDMIREVLTYGTRKENRTGVDTISTFNYNYELCWDESMYGTRSLVQPQSERRYIIDAPGRGEGFAMPLLTTKNVSWKNIVVEMLWFLSGEPNIDILRRHGCKFWDDWADEDGRVPSAYGNFWRRFPTHEGPLHFSSGGVELNFPNGSPGFNDQIAWVLGELRRNPMSRRLVASAWAPGNAQTSKLPPCHMIFAFNVQNVEESLESRVERANQKNPGDNGFITEDLRNQIVNTAFKTPEGRVALDIALRNLGYKPRVEQRLCLHLTQRSADLALGVPYNIASYALLLLVFSHLTGIKPGIFAHTLLDLHIYTGKPDGSMDEYDHIPGLKEQAERAPRTLGRFTIDPSIKELTDIEALMHEGVVTDDILKLFKLSGYDPHPAIKFKVAV